MRNIIFFVLGYFLLTLVACTDNNDRFNIAVQIPDFDFPQTVVFEENLSAYNIFEGLPADLAPTTDFHLLELSSILFTDYAHKQRLIKVPIGEQMKKGNNGSIDFPDGTILTKTFYYYHDERDTSLGKRIIGVC